jgi:hypothetical protein
MAQQDVLERLQWWAGKVRADSESLPEDLSDDELRERQATWYAEYFTLDDGWLYASPDDPAMRERLLDQEGMSPELADLVLAKMSELAASR